MHQKYGGGEFVLKMKFRYFPDMGIFQMKGLNFWRQPTVSETESI